MLSRFCPDESHQPIAPVSEPRLGVHVRRKIRLVLWEVAPSISAFPAAIDRIQIQLRKGISKCKHSFSRCFRH